MRARVVPLAACLVALASPASAQSFSQFYGFGDSTIDSGWWKGWLGSGKSTGNLPKDALLKNAINTGTTSGQPVGAGNLMNSQILASYFGLSANPANQSGGTNYAIAGAVDAAVPANGNAGNLNNSNIQNPANTNTGLPSTAQQIANYLAANGGEANPNGLYLISSGGNDISFAADRIVGGANERAYLTGQAALLTSALVSLQAAGAQYIIVHNDYGTGGLANFYNQVLWSDLASAGVRFVPADIQSVVRYVEANPTQFGFTAATVLPGVVGSASGSACLTQLGASATTTGWGQWCVNSTTSSATHAYLRSANAEQTSFFSDDQHFSAAGQKIEADYDYSLIVAPSQISFLAETPVKTQSMVINTIQNQLAISNSNRGPAGYNAWVSGDISSLSMKSESVGFPGDPGTPMALTAGFDFKNYGWLLGAAFSVNYTQQSFTLLPGGYTQSGGSASLYAAYLDHPFWFDVVGTLGYFRDSINRVVPIGISTQFNNGYTNVYDPSVASEIGYNFLNSDLKHGPVAGVALQRVNVNGFTETGSFTSLSFGTQIRNSAISELGYQATYKIGTFEPFAKLVWNHEWADTNRDVTATLTTIAAPSYFMPAVVLGKDWGTATVGTSAKISQNVKGFALLTSEFAQNAVTTYGGQVGVNVGF
jgi:outer membrane lipase/esterase